MAKPIRPIAPVKGKKRAKDQGAGKPRKASLGKVKTALVPVSQSRGRDAKELKQAKFLTTYERCCHITDAARVAGIAPRTHYDWLASDHQYAARFAMSEPVAVAALEDELMRRAMHGVDEPVWHQGEQCGTVRKYSDRLGEFLLKGRRPDVYGDRMKSELSGPAGGPIDIRNQRLESLSDDELVIVMGLQRKISGDA